MKATKNISAIKLNKRKRALCVILTLFVALTLVTIWGNLTVSIESFNLQTEKLELEKSFKIAHVSDYHNTKINSLRVTVIESLKKEKPNAIFITGDIFDSRKTDIAESVSFVSELVKIAPVYYVTGNHECNVSIDNQKAFDDFIADIKKLGVVVLREESSALELSDGQKINIHGIFDPLFYCSNSTEFTETTQEQCASLEVDERELNILLAHQPEQIAVYANHNFDFVYSGHAHGGQGRLFGVGLIAPDQGFFPKYTSGLYKEGNTTMVVSRGIGNSIVPVRIFCRPHLIYTTIK